MTNLPLIVIIAKTLLIPELRTVAMNNTLSSLRIVLLLCCSFISIPTFAKDIIIGLHLSPPWAYFDNEHEIIGIQPDFYRKALANTPYKISFRMYGYSRLMARIKNKNIDLASPVAIDFPNINYSQKYLHYNIVAISLKNSNLNINSINHLSKHSIVAFQRAKDVLGKEFNGIALSLKDRYAEFVGRERQVDMLFKKRTQVIIGEERILRFLISELYSEDDIVIHPVFPVQHRMAASWDKDLIKALDQGLNGIISSGEYQQLLDLKRPYYKSLENQ